MNSSNTSSTDSPATKHADTSTFEPVFQAVAGKVPPFWPLKNFIASNPLAGFESSPFLHADAMAQRYFHGRALPSLQYFHQMYRKGRITQDDLAQSITRLKSDIGGAELTKLLTTELAHEATSVGAADDGVFTLTEWSDKLNGTLHFASIQSEITKWCSAYFDLDEASWPMPGKSNGLYLAWKDLATHDQSFEKAGVSGFRALVASLPADPKQAAVLLLDKMGVPKDHLDDYLLRTLLASPGWAGLCAFEGSERAYRLKQQGTFGTLLDLLAIRLAYDCAACSLAHDNQRTTTPWDRIMGSGKATPSAKASASATAPSRYLTSGMWLEAFERHYSNQLLGKLRLSRNYSNARKTKQPVAQAVFCIDVRSEVLRRHLEAAGDIETIGFAGFFAVPMAHKMFGDTESSDQVPALIRPKFTLTEQPSGLSNKGKKRLLSRLSFHRLLSSTLREVKQTSVSPFAWVEIFGGIGFFNMLSRAFAPAVRKKGAGAWDALKGTHVKTSLPVSGTEGIPLDERVAIAENSLRIMGLTSGFAKLVLLIGHGSSSTNNAYASALDCGACGGHRGAPNARVSANILNDEEVRQALKERSLYVPSDSHFVAGEHDSATDTVTFLDEDSVPKTLLGDLEQIKKCFIRAGASLTLERTQKFDAPAATHQLAKQDVERRSLDWSEVRPEWGLVGNAAFVIGSRELTKTHNLESRVFLHSYDWKADSSGAFLQVIMTAPMVVTQWINAQYYFSSVDNHTFGSGNKVIQNVVGGLGVMEGNWSDLKIGLPLQSVSDGENLVHEPMRLMVVIEAPRERVVSILQKNESIRKLVANEWIHLVVLDPQDSEFYRVNSELMCVAEVIN